MKPLITMHGFFQTVSLNLWEDARKTWCHEVKSYVRYPEEDADSYQEFGNYLTHMQSQWKDILLEFDAQVVAATDAETILMLQSRAPAFSQEDRSFLAKRFEERLLFPRLTNETLRKAVEEAVYRQGPILTVKTFACDVKILRTRIFAPLSEALGPMRTSKNTTVRTKLLKYFRDRYIERVPTAIGVCAAKEHYAIRCFERLFLQLIRTATGTLSLSESDIRTLAQQEFLAMSSNNRNESPTLEDDCVELPVEKRHGVWLFKRAAVTDSLLANVLRKPQPLGSPISDSFMLKHIISLFLFGTPPSAPSGTSVARSSPRSVARSSPGSVARSSPRSVATSSPRLVATSLPGSSATSLPRAAVAPSRVPFGSSDSPSTQTLSSWGTASDNSMDTRTASHDAWSDLTQHVCGDYRQGPRFVTIADFMSQKGSITGWQSPTVSITPSGSSLKRYATSDDHALFVPEHKRPRLTRPMIFGGHEWSSSERTSVDEQQHHRGSCRASVVSISMPRIASHRSEYMSSEHACSTPPSSLDGEDCYQGDAFSPSDYDRSWTPSTRRSTTAVPNFAFLEEADSYRNLVSIANRHYGATSNNRGPASVDATKRDLSPWQALSPSHATPALSQGSSQHVASLQAAKRDAIVFQLEGNKDMCYRSTRTKKSLSGFVRSQMIVDESSKFSYIIGDKTYDAPTEAHLLDKRALIDVVIVRSERGHFASTQHPNIVHY
jgi:hypothetical protein